MLIWHRDHSQPFPSPKTLVDYVRYMSAVFAKDASFEIRLFPCYHSITDIFWLGLNITNEVMFLKSIICELFTVYLKLNAIKIECLHVTLHGSSLSGAAESSQSVTNSLTGWKLFILNDAFCLPFADTPGKNKQYHSC